MEQIEFINLIFKTEELKLPNKLIRLGYVKVVDENVSPANINNLALTNLGRKVLEGKSILEDLGWITTEYRKKFKDCNPLKFGTKSVTEKKVTDVMKEFGASKQEVLQAVDLYIDTLNGDYSNNVMASADYFAWYMDKQGNKNSKLSQMIELIRESPSSTNKWT